MKMGERLFICYLRTNAKVEPPSASSFSDISLHPSHSILTGIPIKFACHLKNVRVKEKGKARLECEMSSKDVHVKWLKDGRDITDDPRYIFVREGKHAELIVEDSDLADAGEYSIVCTQDNDAQEYVSSADLAVDGRGPD